MPTTYAIPNGRTVMDATLYTGNSSTQSINNSDLGTSGFKPDLVWVKDRSAAQWNNLTDSVRGVGKELFSNATNAEETNGGISSLNSNGFSLINWDGANKSGDSYVAWQWQAGQGTTSTNNDGNRTSTVSVNATAGFSVVTYTFSTSGTNTVGHGLGVAPAFIIMKDRTNAYNWDVYHQSVGYTNRLVLNSTAAAASGFWASTPTSTTFAVTSSMGSNNDAIVAYCWAEIAGFSQFGSYTGNGSSSGPFIYCGFRPSFILVKCTSAVEDWYIGDNKRPTYNSTSMAFLRPDTSEAEMNTDWYKFYSNGFQMTYPGTDTNGSGRTYVYAAFAENPFKYANAR